ncbi:MAG: putative transmembrane CAAX amino terminal protease family [candidate division NC10 bacterium CSP1-5]|nr:MAG: putative transmembrane CAAX amino terminal protease family [candidate division NC10 bacterium CSP1-5]
MGVMWTYVAWLLPTTLLLPAAAKGGAVDVRIAYLVFPIYNLTLVVLLTRYWYRLTWDEVGIPGKYLWGKVAVSLLLAIGYLLISLVEARTGLEEALGNLVDLWEQSRLRFAGRLLFIPIVEELFFRGVAFRVFARQYNPHRAIVLTSFLFAVCHFSFTALPWYFFVGFVLALLVRQPGSTLFAPMILHIALNARYHMSF